MMRKFLSNAAIGVCLFGVGLSARAEPDAELGFEDENKGTWREVFFDPGTEDWQEKWVLDGEIAAVDSTDRGMELRAGPRAFQNAHHMVLWTKRSFGGDLKIEYDSKTFYGVMRNPDLPPVKKGRIGFRFMWTRSAVYRDIRISTPSNGPKE